MRGRVKDCTVSVVWEIISWATPKLKSCSVEHQYIHQVGVPEEHRIRYEGMISSELREREV